MNLCIISCQAILLAVLVIQNHYNEVEAKKHQSSAEEWYVNLQKRTENVLGKMKEGSINGFNQVKKTSQRIFDSIQHALGIGTPTPKKQTTSKAHKDAVKTDSLNNKDYANYFSVSVVSDASDWSDEAKNDTDTEEIQRIPLEKLESSKKKKKIKKHRKKKNKGKDDLNEHKPHEHLSHEQISDLNFETDKAEFGRRHRSKNDKKRHKGKFNTRKFVKIIQREFNNSESDEARRKPVDIIVHIKMNE